MCIRLGKQNGQDGVRAQHGSVHRGRKSGWSAFFISSSWYAFDPKVRKNIDILVLKRQNDNNDAAKLLSGRGFAQLGFLLPQHPSQRLDRAAGLLHLAAKRLLVEVVRGDGQLSGRRETGPPRRGRRQRCAAGTDSHHTRERCGRRGPLSRRTSLRRTLPARTALKRGW